MTKRVLDVGNCAADHAAIRALIEASFAASVVQAHGREDALAELRRGEIDLVLVNRKLDRDYGDGLEIIRMIKADDQLAGVPCILITNYSEHQQQAIQAGAEAGFGKQQLDLPETREKLSRFLS